MQNKYQSEIMTILKQARPRLFTTYQLEFKNVFGAVGAYINGHIFASCGKFGVALRLPPDTLEILFKQKRAKHLKYFPKGHVKKEYAVLPKRILENKGQLREFVDKSIKFVLTYRSMKKFTCREVMNNKGGCDMEFVGETPMAVASQCGKHVAASTDEAHKPMRDTMSNPNHTEEEKKKWFEWFQGEWDKKAEV